MMHFDQAVNEVLLQKKYDVLTNRAFHLYKVLGKLFMDLVHFILSKLNLVFPSGSKYNVDVIKTIFLVLLIAMAIVIILVVFYLLRKKKKKSQTIEEIFDELREESISYEDLFARSQGFAAKGMFREAIRYEFVALLWAMHLGNIIAIHNAKTNRQIRKEISKEAPQLSQPFDWVVNIFQNSWFGHKEVTDEDFRLYHTEISSIMKEVVRFERAL